METWFYEVVSIDGDYANLKRPIMFFMYDFEMYKSQMRDFYLDITELPGPIVYENKELCEMIKRTAKEFVYDEKYIAFNEKFNPLNDGKSSKRALGECIK